MLVYKSILSDPSILDDICCVRDVSHMLYAHTHMEYSIHVLQALMGDVIKSGLLGYAFTHYT